MYGGPCVQRVINHWTTFGDLSAQRLAQAGFLVVKCDNRGSSRRGNAFESAIHLNVGSVEVSDQVAVVQYLTSLGFADASNVGIYGWSYGGYMSAISLCKAPTVFKAACAGAPVTFWEGYDTFYTERYMSTPEKNSDGYKKSSVMNNVDDMRGGLLIIHGLIDENVHFRHSASLIDSLNTLQKRYDVLLFPNERHSPHRISDKVYMEDRILEFFRTHLTLTQNRGFGSGISNHGLSAPGHDPGQVESSGRSNEEKLMAHL